MIPSLKQARRQASYKMLRHPILRYGLLITFILIIPLPGFSREEKPLPLSQLSQMITEIEQDQGKWSRHLRHLVVLGKQTLLGEPLAATVPALVARNEEDGFRSLAFHSVYHTEYYPPYGEYARLGQSQIAKHLIPRKISEVQGAVHALEVASAIPPDDPVVFQHMVAEVRKRDLSKTSRRYLKVVSQIAHHYPRYRPEAEALFIERLEAMNLEQLANVNSPTRHYTNSLLSWLGNISPQTVKPELITRFLDRNYGYTTDRAAYLMLQMEDRAAPLVKLLVQRAADSGRMSDSEKYLLDCISKMAHLAVDDLSDLMIYGSDQDRLYAAWALTKCGEKSGKAMEALTAALADSNFYVRRYACQAIRNSRKKNPAAEARLKDLLLSQDAPRKSEEKRTYYAAVLESLASVSSGSQATLDVMLDAETRLSFPKVAVIKAYAILGGKGHQVLLDRIQNKSVDIYVMGAAFNSLDQEVDSFYEVFNAFWDAANHEQRKEVFSRWIWFVESHPDRTREVTREILMGARTLPEGTLPIIKALEKQADYAMSDLVTVLPTSQGLAALTMLASIHGDPEICIPAVLEQLATLQQKRWNENALETAVREFTRAYQNEYPLFLKSVSTLQKDHAIWVITELCSADPQSRKLQQAVAELLNDPRVEVRLAALHGLSQLKQLDPDVLNQVQQQLVSPGNRFYPDLKEAVCQVLISHATSSRSFASDILDLKNDQSYRLQLAAIITTGYLATDLQEKEQITFLENALCSNDPLKRYLAARALGRIGDPAISLLEQTLESEQDRFTRHAAAYALSLSKKPSERCLQLLKKYRLDPEYLVAEQCRISLLP